MQLKNWLLALTFFAFTHGLRAQLGIGTDSPHASSMLDVTSTSTGMLIPRMTTAQRTAIASPAMGLLVFDNETVTFWFYNGNVWTELVATGSGGGNWTLSGTNIYNSNAGNVGIGVNPPLAPLHLKKDNEAMRIEGTSPYLAFYNTAGTASKVFVQSSGNNLYLGTSTGNAGGITQIYANQSPLITFLPAGNIGIGTATPANKLTVQAAGYGLTHTNGVATVGTWIGSFQGTSTAMLGTKSNHSLNFFTADATSQMRLETNGNVVVGESSVVPFGKLSVQTTNNTYGISHLGEGGNILATRMGGTSAGIGTFSNTNMRIFAGGTSAVFIGSGNNNVGIGIEFPTHKLEVNGTVRTKEIIVENNNWPDYVFQKTYRLTSLEEVERFIQKNNHLPGIESAAIIKAKGQAVGQIQAKMMEKIEELTLYVIELKKSLTELKKIHH